MAEVSQYSFSLQDVAAALAKQQNIREGRWMLAIEFTIGIGLFGAQRPEARPGAVIQADKVQLVRASADSPANLVVDAATLY
jgi:hypothetical protein